MAVLLPLMTTACSYDENISLCTVCVRLVYPENSTGPYAGARVELKDASASVFEGETNDSGKVLFSVPAGLYEVSSSSSFTDKSSDTWWQYNYNGVRSQILISHEHSEDIDLELKMSRKRIVH